MTNTLSTIGLIGAAVALLCSFTPLLPAVLPVIGLADLVPVLHNDSVLLPLVIAFLALSAIGLWMKPQR